MSNVESFAAVIGEQAKTLLLGSAPSVKSLDVSEYYAHPQNAFWWIMGQMLDFDHKLAYQDRCQRLIDNGFGLWDVVARCQREGSLDSNIRSQGRILNDIEGLLHKNESITTIAFNGQTAARLFTRGFSPSVYRQRDLLALPSTSAANALLNRQQKLKHWRQALVKVA